MSIKHVLFYESKDEHGHYTNFYPLSKPLKIGEEEWTSTEQYFQAMKFRGKGATKRMIEYSNIIKNADSPMKVKMLGTQRKNMRFGKKWKVNKKTDERLVNDIIDKYKDIKMRDDWDEARIVVMINAVYRKFTQDPKLYNIITSLPDDVYLVEHTTRDKVWGDGGDGGDGSKGSNYLGKTLTALSYYLKHGDADMPANLRDKIKIGREVSDIPAPPSFSILSWNINGIRSNILSTGPYNKCGVQEIESASSLGVVVSMYDPDILCFQETRCDEEISGCIQIPGYYQYWSCSHGKGPRQGNRYSGVAIWTKIKPKEVIHNLPTLPEPDNEGRILILVFDKFTLMTTYSPNSGTNMEYRVNVWDVAVKKYLRQQKKAGILTIWCGDMNVAPAAPDVYFSNPQSSRYCEKRMSGIGCQATAGFTKEERDNFTKILKEGYIDAFRYVYPKVKDAFTWWSMRVPSDRKTNKGMRLDHFVLPNDAIDCILDINILNEVNDESVRVASDHAPIILSLRPECILNDVGGSL
jgi:exodeoxyribonuclease III